MRLKNVTLCINSRGIIRSVFAEWQCFCDPGLHTCAAQTSDPGQVLLS